MKPDPSRTQMLYFSLGLPLGPTYWFGVGFMQILSQMLSTHAKFVPLSYLGYFCTAIPLLLLLIFMFSTKEHKNRQLLITGFILSTLFQPLLFLAWNGGL